MPLASLFNLQWYGPQSAALVVSDAQGIMEAQAVREIRPALNVEGIGTLHVMRPYRGYAAALEAGGLGLAQMQGVRSIRAQLTVSVNELSQDDVTGAVWQALVEPGTTYQEAIIQLLAGGGGGGGGLTVSQDQRLTRIEKILANKMITDPSTGTMRLYDDDGTTLLLQADLFQDAAGTIPYQGQGVERREKLT
jgi:hypothetical protein